MRGKRLAKLLIGLACAALVLGMTGVAFADGPDTGEPGHELIDSTEIWADIEASLITRLEPCETFGTISTGVKSTLATNPGNGSVYVYTYDGANFPSTDNQGAPTSKADAIADLHDWGPGVLNGAGVLQQTDYIDYNVSGNVVFSTKVYAEGDFQEVDDLDTIPVANRLEIEDNDPLGGVGDSGAWATFAGTGDTNAIEILTDQDPTNAGDAGLTYDINLRLDVPDDTLPGLYHTTLTFVTYQS